jgi:biopolymer transport protein TolR
LALIAGPGRAQSIDPSKPMLREGIHVEMAITPHAEAMPDADREDAAVVSVTEAGDAFLAVTPISPSEIPGRLQTGKAVYVKADARAHYGNVLKVLSALQNAGISRAGLLTVAEGATAPGNVKVPSGLMLEFGVPPVGASVIDLSASDAVTALAKVKDRQALPTGVEKAVYVKAADTTPFSEIAKAIDSIHAAGAKAVLVTHG